MKYFARFLIGIVFLVPAQAYAMAPFETDLHFAFQIHCEEESQQATESPIASPDASPAAEECETEIPFDEQQDAYRLTAFTANEPIEVDLYVKNPRQEMVTSIRAKLKYDPLALSVIELNTDESDFPLGAPGENNIDEDSGTITIGRALTGGSLSNEEFFIGTLTLLPYNENGKLEFLNYQNTELGDTGIYFTSGITSQNRLANPPKPLIFGMGDPMASGSPTPSATPDGGIGGDDPMLDDDDILFPPTEEDGFGRPQGLRIQTDDAGNVRLVWPIATDPPVKGYYLYYGQKSGFYLRRRDVGRTNFAVFPDLPMGERYYFAITAYNADDNETDYSDEVFVTIGQPGSESHGFLGDPRSPEQPGDGTFPTPTPTYGPNLDGVGQNPGTGPEHVLFFLLISTGLAFVFFAFRRT